MIFNILSIEVSTILQYFNFFVIGMVVFGALIGFLRGTIKSTYFMIMTLVIFIGGWLLMNPIIDGMMKMNLSALNLSPFGIELENPTQFLSDYVSSQYADYGWMLNAESYSYAFLISIIAMVLRVVYIFGLIGISFSLFYLISGLLWLFFRPKKNKVTGKRKKPSIWSRLGGMGIGAAKGLLYTLFFSFILAGLASVSDSLRTLNSQDNEQVGVIFIGETATFIDLAANNEEIPPKTSGPLDDLFNEYGDVFELLSGYRKTIPGQVFGTIKVGDNKTTLDEMIFDGIFSLNVKDEKIKLRDELKTLSKILNSSAVQEAMGGEFDIQKILTLPDSELREIVDAISAMKLIKVIVPVGIEFMAYSKELGFSDEISGLLLENLEELVQIDYADEIKKLGYTFVDFLTLVPGLNFSEIDYFNLDTEVLDQIFANIAELEILKIAAPIAIGYLIDSETFKQTLIDFGTTAEELGLVDLDYVAELLNINDIYKAMRQLGIERVDGVVDLSNLETDAIGGFTEALFKSNIINKAFPVILNIASQNFMPENYQQIFVKEEIEAVDWENELTPLLKAVAILFKTKVIDLSGEADMITNLKNLTNDDINDLSLYLSESTFLCSKLNTVITSLFQELGMENLSMHALDEDAGELWDKKEIGAIFKIMKALLDYNLINDSVDVLDSLKALSNEQIEDVCKNIADSNFITKNINSLLEFLISSDTFHIATLNKDEYTQNELVAVFKSLRLLVDYVIDGSVSLDSFVNISEADLDIIIESKLIRATLIDFLCTNAVPGGQLEVLKGVYVDGKDANDITVYNWNDTIEETRVEVIGNVLTITPVANARKYLIYCNDVYFMSTSSLSIDLESIDVDNEYSAIAIVENGELRNIFNAISKLTNLDLTNSDFDLKPIVQNADVIFESYIIVETIISQIRNLESGIVIPVEYQEGGTGQWRNINTSKGELSLLIDALNIIFSGDSLSISNIDTDSIDLREVVANKDEIFKSAIITATLIDNIQKLDTMITISSDYVVPINPSWETDYQKWKNIYNAEGLLIQEGELSYFINSLDICLGLTSSENPKPISELDSINFNLREIVDNRDEILRSNVFATTIIAKLTEQDAITIPSEYRLSNNPWMNVYDDNGIVTKNGELSYIFKALDYILDLDNTDINNIVLDNVDLKEIIDNKDEIFNSVIISATVIKNIIDLDQTIVIPDEYKIDYTDLTSTSNSWELGYVKWRKTYDQSGVLINNGELNFFLDAVDAFLGISQSSGSMTINDLQNNLDNIYIEKIINSQDIILHSYILSATFIDKIQDLNGNGLNLPNDYQNKTDYSLWMNNYSLNVVNTYGELSRLLNSIEIVLQLDGTTQTEISNVSINNVDLAYITDDSNCDNMLYSVVITETLKMKIIEFSSNASSPITLPSNYNNQASPNFIKWENEYNASGIVTNYGELSYLLKAIHDVLGTATINDMKGFDYSVIFGARQDDILRSLVISETIISALVSNGDIKIPEGYDLDVSSDRTAWYNSYDGAIVRKELASLLGAINLIIDTDELSTLTTSNIKYNSLFETTSQDVILKSKVISETIICQIEQQSGTIYIPNGYNLKNSEGNKRDAWFNKYTNDSIERRELSALVNSFSLLLTDIQKSNLDNIDLSDNLNAIMNDIKNDSNEEFRIKLLSSLVVCETLVHNISGQNSIMNNIATTELTSGKVLQNESNRQDWYSLDSNFKPEKKELWNLLTGISILITSNDLTNIASFTIDDIIGNASMIPLYDSNFNITESNIAIILESAIIENIFADIVMGIVNGGFGNLINEPTGGYKWYKLEAIAANSEYDLCKFLESFYLMNPYMDYNNPANSASTLIRLGDGNHETELGELGAAMVISRIFKNSIAKMYNNIFGVIYPTDSIAALNGMKTWNEVKFDEQLYNDPVSKTNAHANFIVQYHNLYNELAKLPILP